MNDSGLIKLRQFKCGITFICQDQERTWEIEKEFKQMGFGFYKINTLLEGHDTPKFLVYFVPTESSEAKQILEDVVDNNEAVQILNRGGLVFLEVEKPGNALGCFAFSVKGQLW
ncbi:MAG: hypothetical protein ABJN36_19315 [Cyclobacteriaceae bacterium]|uniref:hypothetical protein n=1 Tax=Reichenbachiella sp. TaxID=2184521 RepID=UPI003265BC3F